MLVYYLHGFASSARSKKAAYLSERFGAHGVDLVCPDFNEPAFATLTLTRMLDQLAEDVGSRDAQPVVLIGSSLGGVVAIHAAARLGSRIDRLVLLAPALRFGKDDHRFLTPDRVTAWRDRGTLDVFHYAYGEARPLNYTFYEDSLRYDAREADVQQPMRIFQGRRDESVDARDVERYAAGRSHAQLTVLDDDHQLLASLPEIWTETERFLGLA
jgi:pimeloyl-ACP methyl ester carboxylesterase